MVVDNDCAEVTAAIVSQLRNVLPSAPKEYVCLSVCLSLDQCNGSVCLHAVVVLLGN